jgi:hypothetical protein
MKTIQTLFLVFAFGLLTNIQAQATKVNYKSQLAVRQNTSYYQQRAREDAQYEQQFRAGSKKEERAFWKEQKEYEKNLKSQDRRSYRVYIEAKNDAYAAHYHNCNATCHHSDYYYHNAGYYYYEYRQPRYNKATRATINTNIGVSTPSVRLGLF